jgi:hypothetical protein
MGVGAVPLWVRTQATAPQARTRLHVIPPPAHETPGAQTLIDVGRSPSGSAIR